MQNVIKLEDSILCSLQNMRLTNDDMYSIQQTKEIEKGFYQGHLISVIARPNAGKTALAISLSKKFSSQNYNVQYINADVSSSEVYRYQEQAEKHHFALIVPDIKQGLGIGHVKQKLTELSSSDADLSNYIFIIDTLKKFTSMINKRNLSETLSMFRRLSALGATIILLAHTNKYPTPDGEDIFEGCGDLLADTDELYYLYSMLEANKQEMAVQLVCRKSRCDIRPDSSLFFSLDLSLFECEIDPVGKDISFKKIAEQQYEEDKEIVDSVIQALNEARENQLNQGDLIKAVSLDTCIANRPIKEVLNRYTEHFWALNKGLKNANLYTLISKS